METTELFARSTSWAAAKLDEVRPHQLDDPTILSGWSVRDLLNHMVGQHLFFAQVATGGAPEAPGGGGPMDLFGDDPGSDYRRATATAQEAFSHQDALERTVSVPAGEMTGAQFWSVIWTEALIHGWDLARSTGQDATMDVDLAAAAYHALEPIAEYQRELGFYGPEVPIASDAPIQDRLLGLVGRSPDMDVR